MVRTSPRPSAWTINAPQWLTIVVMLLASVAALAGLFVPHLYRDPITIVPALRGQDAITLLSLPCLLVALVVAQRGSLRATLVWIGLLGYLLYTYLGAAIGYFLNPLTLLYIALFSLSLAALVLTLQQLDLHQLEHSFDQAVPRIPVMVFFALITLMLGVREVLENIGFIQTGVLPAGMRLAGGTNYYVYTLDLGVIVPLCLLSIWWLWRRDAWGFVSTAVVLVKAAVMGLALLAMNGFNALAGQPVDDMILVWVLIALGGLGLSVWFLAHCHAVVPRSRSKDATDLRGVRDPA